MFLLPHTFSGFERKGKGFGAAERSAYRAVLVLTPYTSGRTAQSRRFSCLLCQPFFSPTVCLREERRLAETDVLCKTRLCGFNTALVSRATFSRNCRFFFRMLVKGIYSALKRREAAHPLKSADKPHFT
jgi:hypothetical protein